MRLKVLRHRYGEANRPPLPRRKLVRLALLSSALGLVALGLAGSFAAGVVLHRNGTIKRARAWTEIHIGATYWQGLLVGPSLPTLTVDMSFRNLQTIQSKRAEALERGILLASDNDFVPATIRYDGRIIRADMRLKGDWVDHLRGSKWSYRIEVKGDQAVLGFRRFSIQDPTTRNYLFEWGYLEHLRSEDILAPRYKFASVVFNGDKLGIYAVEEHFSKELLESQGRRDGVIVRFNESALWEQRALNGGKDTSIFAAYDYTVSVVDAFRDGRIDKSPTLTAQRDAAVGLLRGYAEGRLAASEVFDIQLMGRFLAVNELWASTHALAWHNLRFYYNPMTGKLEPIGFDAQPKFVSSPLLVAIDILDLTDDPAISEAYVSSMARMSSAEYLADLKAKLQPQYEQLRKELAREYGSLQTPWEMIRTRQRVIRGSLNTVVTVQAFSEGMPPEATSTGGSVVEVDVRNILRLPVEVLGFSIAGGEFVPANTALAEPSSMSGWLPRGSSVVLLGTEGKRTSTGREIVPFRISMASLGSQQSGTAQSGAEIEVISRLLGLTEPRVSVVQRYPQALEVGLLPKIPSIDEALAAHPYLGRTSDPSMLQISPGVWTIEADIVLPEGMGLYIGPGTTLRFAPGAMLLARGPLLFLGTAEQPVILGPIAESWPGVAVLEAGQPSFWEHTVVESTHGVERGGWMLTGGITFYKSPITFLRTRIAGSTAEDAVNIIHTSFRFDHTEIGDTVSDAFDGDFTSGVIIDSSFHDIGGDAIDVSGSAVTVQNVLIRNVGDKAVSAGESSNVEVARLEVDNVGIGVASKDSSRVSISDSTIGTFVNAGLAAYTKKPEYGPGSIVATNVKLEGETNPTIIQTGSWIQMDGKRLGGTDLDVQALYEAGILGN